MYSCETSQVYENGAIQQNLTFNVTAGKSFVLRKLEWSKSIPVRLKKRHLEQTPLNRCQQLPAPYKRLINDTKTEKQ